MKHLYLFLALSTLASAQTGTVNPTGEGISNPTFRNAVLPTQSGQSGKYLKTDGTAATWETVTSNLTSGPVTSSSGVSAIADAALSIEKTSGLQTALASKIAISNLSSVGGANKVLQFDGDGNLRLGPYNNGNVFGTGGGTLIIPDKRYIEFRDQNGNLDATIGNWGDHGSSTENELIINSAGRVAVTAYRGLQMSPNDAARYTRYMEFTSGYATSTVNETLMPSMSAVLQTKAWNGSESVDNHIALQAKPLDSSGNNSILNIHDHATVIDSLTNDPTATRGDIAGTLIAQIYKDGIWSNGTAPAFDTLTDGATITDVCSKYKTAQSAKVTLGGNRTLSLSGLISGMRGVIYVSQDNVGSRLLTLPSGSCTDASWALSTTPFAIDRLAWEFDGTFLYWSIVKGLQQPADSDATAFIAAAAITDNTQKLAINALVLELKAFGLWSKSNIAFWPFVGGNATAHSKELKGVYNGTFPNGMTHSSDGITGNGTSHYFQSGYDFAAVSALNSASIYVYNKTPSPTTGGSFAGSVGSSNMRCGLRNEGGNLGGYVINANSTLSVISVSGDFRGHLAVTRSASNLTNWGKNGLSGADATVSSTACDRDITFLARSFVGFSEDQFSNANIAFAMIGPALTTQEWTDFRAVVDRFQTALGRANP